MVLLRTISAKTEDSLDAAGLEEIAPDGFAHNEHEKSSSNDVFYDHDS